MDKEFKRIAIFDLDGTLYRKSSKITFFIFLCKKNPLIFQYMVRMLIFTLLHKVGVVSRETYKAQFFSYLNSVSPADLPALVDQFWKEEFPKNFNKTLLLRMEKLKKEKVGIFIITGTAEFLAHPLKKKLGVDVLIGTRLNHEKDGIAIKGKTCNDKEKVKRLAAVMHIKKHTVKEAFSDKEEPILEIAEESFLLENGKMRRYK